METYKVALACLPREPDFLFFDFDKYKELLQGAANFSYHGNIYVCMVVKVMSLRQAGDEEQKAL